MPKQEKPISTGIHGIIGAPGSGKSYAAIREMVRVAIKEVRPVYTNLPVRIGPLRAYVYQRAKGSKAYRRRIANLIRPISKDHFNAFCVRLHDIDQRSEQLRKDHSQSNGGTLATFNDDRRRQLAVQQIETEQGPPVIVGPNANWVPAGACMFLDELHKWYSSKKYKDESDEVLAYTSMHRHMLHKCYIISQRLMNISLSFRAMMVECCFVTNYARKPILGIQLYRFFNVFRYQYFNGDEIEESSGKPKIGAKPVWSEVHCPELEGGVIFRLYQSHVHAGSITQLQAELKKTVDDAIGVEQQEEEIMLGAKHVPFWRKHIWAILALVGGAVIACVLWLGDDEPETVAAHDEQTTQAVEGPATGADVPGASGGEPELPLWLQQAPTEEELAATMPWWMNARLTGLGDGVAYIGRRKYAIGEESNGLRLFALDRVQGWSIWIELSSGRFVRWDVGGAGVYGVLPSEVLARMVQDARPAAERFADDPAAAPVDDAAGLGTGADP